MSEDPKPWERLDGETPRAYQAFRTYRDTPATERSVEALAGEFGVHPNTVKRWSATHKWVERATAWDDTLHRTIDDKRLSEVTEMYERHITVGKIATHKALLALQNLDPKLIPAGAAARLLELGTRIERDMLTVTPEDLLGADSEAPGEDAWEALGRELGLTVAP